MFLDAGHPSVALLQTVSARGGATAHVRRILGDSRPTAPTAPTAATARTPLVDELSHRELDVLRLLRSELSGPEIARELTVSLNTLRTHTKNIYAKLGVSTRREAVRRAASSGSSPAF